jgi:hypothetical protein
MHLTALHVCVCVWSSSLFLANCSLCRLNNSGSEEEQEQEGWGE